MKVRKFLYVWWPWILDICVVVFFVAFFFSLIGCKSSKVVSELETMDSVVYVYKTLYRDSLRVKDSTIIVYETVQRDSVVLRVDKETGEVLSKDTWHWKDTNRDRDHVSDVRNKAEKIDSASSVVAKSDKRAAVPQDSIKPLCVKETHYWRTWWLGVSAGIIIALLYKYRKNVFLFVSKCVKRGA